MHTHHVSLVHSQNLRLKKMKRHKIYTGYMYRFCFRYWLHTNVSFDHFIRTLAGCPKPRREKERRKSRDSRWNIWRNLFIQIWFPPLTFEQLPLNPWLTNFSFKGTNKCVARLDDIDLEAESQYHITSLSAGWVLCNRKTLCMLFLLFYLMYKNELQADLILYYKNI